MSVHIRFKVHPWVVFHLTANITRVIYVFPRILEVRERKKLHNAGYTEHLVIFWNLS